MLFRQVYWIIMSGWSRKGSYFSSLPSSTARTLERQKVDILKPQREKWDHCFHAVLYIIFLACMLARNVSVMDWETSANRTPKASTLWSDDVRNNQWLYCCKLRIGCYRSSYHAWTVVNNERALSFTQDAKCGRRNVVLPLTEYPKTHQRGNLILPFITIYFVTPLVLVCLSDVIWSQKQW